MYFYALWIKSMLSFAEIKNQFQTCTDKDFERLRVAIREFLKIEKGIKIGIDAWPYTQAMRVTWDRHVSWVGVCATDSSLGQGKSCPCGKCDWTMGQGELVVGNQITQVCFN